MRNVDRSWATLKGMAPTTPPPDTCPLIDAVLKNLTIAEHAVGEVRLQAMNSAEPVDIQRLAEDLALAVEQLKPLTDTMEAIRQANARLRNLSLYWFLVAKRLHEEANAQAA